MKTDKIKAHFQWRHLRQGRWLRVLLYRWNYQRTTWSDSKDSKYRNCNSTNSLIHNRSWCGKFHSETQVTCSDFPSDAMLWNEEVEMVNSLNEFKSSISLWRGFSKLRDAGREDCFCSEQDHPDFPIQQEGQSRGAESPTRVSVCTRKTDRVHDLRLFSSDWRS